jgi:hypothetical protein
MQTTADYTVLPLVVLFGIRPQRPDRLTRPPDLLLINLLELPLKVLSVGLAAVELERLARLGSVLHRLVQFFKDGLVGSFKDWRPVQCTTSGCG